MPPGMTPPGLRKQVVDVFIEALGPAYQGAFANHACYVAGGTEDEGQIILIVQSATGEDLLITDSDCDYIEDQLNELARLDEEQERGLVGTFANCKWAFYYSKFSPPSPILSVSHIVG